jgi:hypothetical protein
MKFNPVPRRKLWGWFTKTDFLLPHFHFGPGDYWNQPSFNTPQVYELQGLSSYLLYFFLGVLIIFPRLIILCRLYTSEVLSKYGRRKENIQMYVWILLLFLLNAWEMISEKNIEQMSTNFSSLHLVMTVVWYLTMTKKPKNQKQRHN